MKFFRDLLEKIEKQNASVGPLPNGKVKNGWVVVGVMPPLLRQFARVWHNSMKDRDRLVAGLPGRMFSALGDAFSSETFEKGTDVLQQAHMKDMHVMVGIELVNELFFLSMRQYFGVVPQDGFKFLTDWQVAAKKPANGEVQLPTPAELEQRDPLAFMRGFLREADQAVVPDDFWKDNETPKDGEMVVGELPDELRRAFVTRRKYLEAMDEHRRSVLASALDAISACFKGEFGPDEAQSRLQKLEHPYCDVCVQADIVSRGFWQSAEDHFGVPDVYGVRKGWVAVVKPT